MQSAGLIKTSSHTISIIPSQTAFINQSGRIELKTEESKNDPRNELVATGVRIDLFHRCGNSYYLFDTSPPVGTGKWTPNTFTINTPGPEPLIMVWFQRRSTLELKSVTIESRTEEIKVLFGPVAKERTISFRSLAALGDGGWKADAGPEETGPESDEPKKP